MLLKILISIYLLFLTV